jgi:hypothetical protein
MNTPAFFNNKYVGGMTNKMTRKRLLRNIMTRYKSLAKTRARQGGYKKTKKNKKH